MSPSKIQVGKTYRNRGAGKTTRTVIEIGADIEAPWLSDSKRPDEPVVRYRQNNQSKDRTLYLGSFAYWCGSEVSE